jgi:rfaE bifunctional protein nucleotidyltransferase chain/domain
MNWDTIYASSSTKKRVVLVGGCFDILHAGHIEFLTQAKQLGDALVVALESDQNVTQRKGELRPIHTQNQRKTMLEALTVVDHVILLPFMQTDHEYLELVTYVKPAIIAVTVGDPYLPHKQKQAETIGSRVVEIPKIPKLSTSLLTKLIGLE